MFCGQVMDDMLETGGIKDRGGHHCSWTEPTGIGFPCINREASQGAQAVCPRYSLVLFVNSRWEANPVL